MRAADDRHCGARPDGSEREERPSAQPSYAGCTYTWHKGDWTAWEVHGAEADGCDVVRLKRKRKVQCVRFDREARSAVVTAAADEDCARFIVSELPAVRSAPRRYEMVVANPREQFLRHNGTADGCLCDAYVLARLSPFARQSIPTSHGCGSIISEWSAWTDCTGSPLCMTKRRSRDATCLVGIST